MGNSCCSGESLSDAERKELEELRRKKNEYSEKVEEEQVMPSTSISTQRQNHAEQQQIEYLQSNANRIYKNDINRTSLPRKNEEDLNQIIQDAIWPPVVNNQSEPVEESTSQYDHERIQNNVWPPLDSSNNTDHNNMNSQAINERSLDENIEHNLWPPSSLSSSPKPNNRKSEAMNNDFTNNIWPPPPHVEIDQSFDKNSTVHTDQDIQRNIWPPPTPPSNDMESLSNRVEGITMSQNNFPLQISKENINSIKQSNENNQQLKLEKPHF